MKVITKHTEVFTFQELSEKAKAKALADYYDINTDFNWYECNIEYWQEKLGAIGFENAEIFFSGFSSQGDGACFDSDINLDKLARHLNCNLQRLAPFMEYLSGHISTINNHYSHEHTRRFSLDDCLPDNYPCMENYLNDFADSIEALRLELCKALYKELEKEYYFLCSDEQIIESFEANEFVFTKDGKLYN